ncbi:MAG TPA: hypothetical protein DCQ77_01390 [Betaproteobacteria bacterium]|nr:hypothetical protein [Betaproteobacteria bacterium]
MPSLQDRQIHLRGLAGEELAGQQVRRGPVLHAEPAMFAVVGVIMVTTTAIMMMAATMGTIGGDDDR